MKTRNKFFLIYYIALLLIMAFHASTESTLMLVRIGYFVALFLPLIGNYHFFPAILICVLLISQNSFAYPLVPDDNYYYVILSAGFAFLAAIHNKTEIAKQDRLSPIFFFLIVYLGLSNIVLDGKVLDITSSVFICVMVYVCASKNLPINSRLISLAFMFFSVSMSYLLFFHPEARTIAAHGVDNTTWADPNYMGGMVGIGCTLAVMSIINMKKSLWQFVFYIITIIASLYFLSHMASRGAILAVGMATIALTLFSKVKKSTKLLTLIGVVGVLLFVYNSEAFEVLVSRFDTADTTGTGRTLIWAAKLKGFVQEGSIFNILFGFGAEGGFSLGTSDLGFVWAFHNDFVAVLCEYGIVGFVLYLSLLAYPFRIASKEDKPIIGALLLYIVTLGLTLEPVMSGRFVFIAYLLFIMILAKGGVQRDALDLNIKFTNVPLRAV